LEIAWTDDRLIGRIFIDDELWCAVEWSEKRQAWCIEDAEGRCLSHRAHVHGQAAAEDDAVALAFEMIRDGRMPSPEQARQTRQARLERRRLQPAQQRRRAERKARREDTSKASYALWDAERREKGARRSTKLLSEIFDFADPELWKSNSFAALRPRLLIHVRGSSRAA